MCAYPAHVYLHRKTIPPLIRRKHQLLLTPLHHLPDLDLVYRRARLGDGLNDLEYGVFVDVDGVFAGSGILDLEEVVDDNFDDVAGEEVHVVLFGRESPGVGGGGTSAWGCRKQCDISERADGYIPLGSLRFSASLESGEISSSAGRLTLGMLASNAWWGAVEGMREQMREDEGSIKGEAMTETQIAWLR